uniref:Protein kinase domain-containing protein n=1 Tax=Aegilops tauschii subsp. strangulata TaxID=200361 RepID=A0A453E191_AEGTS
MEAKLQCTGDEPSKIPYQLLKQITNDFDKERILGSGSYGTVYKVWIKPCFLLSAFHGCALSLN